MGAALGGLAGVVAGTAAAPGALDRLNIIAVWVLPLPIEVEDLLPTAAVQIGGVIGGALGVVFGAAVTAWLAVTEFWRLLYEGDPAWP